MSLTINNNLIARPLLTTPSSGTAALRDQNARSQVAPGAAKSATIAPAFAGKQVAGAPGSSSALPVQPPPGTDPELWSVLSADERGFFAKAGAMGPLTYGRMTTAQAAPTVPALRGGRLDIRG
jgi:hypothetical protein